MATMVGKRDYYEVLGVDRNASQEEIAQAYRQLALKYHPDRNPGDQQAVARFKEAAEAFEVLGNPEKRARYDRYGHAGIESMPGGAREFHDIGDILDAFSHIFGDGLFGDLFGTRTRGGRRVHRGRDIVCSVELDLEELLHPTTKTIRFERHEPCVECGGTGVPPGSSPEHCSYCGGRGRIVHARGFIKVEMTCPACGGNGSVVREPCSKCRGSGFVLRTVTREVRIPPGVNDQTRLRLAGEGDPSPDGGPRGDCYCVVHIRRHPIFRREGRNLVCQVPIGYAQAALGTELEVPTLEGSHILRIPRGTQHGDVFHLRGLGLPSPRTRSRGDLVVQVLIEVPTDVTAEHEQILRQLAEIESQEVSPARKSFFSKLREYFQSR